MSGAGGGYDLAVIGAGPGGYVAAIRAAQLGLRPLLIDRDARLGGVCTLRGCIPTKALLHTADLLDDARAAASAGVVARDVTVDWAAARAYQERVVQQNSNGVTFLMRKHQIDVVQGTGSLVGAGSIRVLGADGGARTYTARHIVLATGSAPRPLPGLPFDGQRVLSSDHVLELPALPPSLAIVGGGVVGVEMASLFARLGTSCTLIEAMPRLLPGEDEELSAELQRGLRRQGVRALTGATVEDVEVGDAGVIVRVRAGDARHDVAAARLLVAIGRTPLTAGLGLDACGVTLAGAHVSVDGRMRTTAPTVYAIGDVVSTPALAHVASAEATIAVEAIAGLDPEPLDADAIPNAVYTSPEVASVGLTEARARDRGLDPVVGRFPFAASGKARVLGQGAGFIKIVAARDPAGRAGRVLGGHMVGPRVTELLGAVTMALRLRGTATDLARVVTAHPTLAESIREAAEAALGGATHV